MGKMLDSRKEKHAPLYFWTEPAPFLLIWDWYIVYYIPVLKPAPRLLVYGMRLFAVLVSKM